MTGSGVWGMQIKNIEEKPERRTSGFSRSHLLCNLYIYL
jgi:hypothetical protein